MNLLYLFVPYLFFFLIHSLFILQPVEVKKFVITGQAQGTTYQILYYSTDSIINKKQIDSILNKLDSSLSLYKPYSLINAFNTSEKGMEMDEHFEKVVKKSFEACRTTNGIFDITVQPLVAAWGFGVEVISKLPDSATIDSLKRCVGSRQLKIVGNELVKAKNCVKVDMNGIAQGYSVDVIAGFMLSSGIENFMVELGGEIRVKGRRPDNSLMRIGIEAPGEDAFDMSLMKKVIAIENGAITTSGSYRKYYESKGKKLTHIIDPRTGYPAINELISVTVYARDAITADAYDNALMVMGLKKALAFTKRRKDISAHFVYRDMNGAIRDTATASFRKILVQ